MAGRSASHVDALSLANGEGSADVNAARRGKKTKCQEPPHDPYYRRLVLSRSRTAQTNGALCLWAGSRGARRSHSYTACSSPSARCRSRSSRRGESLCFGQAARDRRRDCHARTLVPAYHPRSDTYLFVEMASPGAAELAVRHLNGQQLGGSQLIVTPASTLSKLFIGFIERTVGAPR